MIFDRPENVRGHVKMGLTSYPKGDFDTAQTGWIRCYEDFCQATKTGVKNQSLTNPLTYETYLECYPLLYFDLSKNDNIVEGNFTENLKINFATTGDNFRDKAYQIICWVVADEYYTIDIAGGNFAMRPHDPFVDAARRLTEGTPGLAFE